MRVAETVDQADPVLSEKRSRLGGRVARDEDVAIWIPPEVPCLADELPGSRRVGVSLHLEHDRCPPIAEPHDAIDTVIASHRRSCLDCLDPGHAPKQLER